MLAAMSAQTACDAAGPPDGRNAVPALGLGHVAHGRASATARRQEVAALQAGLDPA